MFSKVLILALFLSSYSYAFSEKVVDWKKNKLRKVERSFPELVGKDRFETKSIRIVKGRSETPIRFSDSDKDLLLQAYTTFYHINKSQKYFETILPKESFDRIGQLTIRLEMTDKFNENGHYANHAKEDVINNATSVPAGPKYDFGDVEPWGHEIWFRPSKLLIQKSKDQSIVNEIVEVYELLNQSDYYIRFLGILSQLIHGQEVNIEEELLDLGQSYALDKLEKEALRTGLNAINYNFKFIESALIPGIIYHEYVHVILSDKLSINHSTPVNEGFANYFAARILDRDQVSTRFSKYAIAQVKDGQSDDDYLIEHELRDYAQSDFTFSLLYQVGEIVGGNLKMSEDKFFLSLVNKVDSYTMINPNLTKIIVRECSFSCKKPFVQKMKILSLFNDRGL